MSTKEKNQVWKNNDVGHTFLLQKLIWVVVLVHFVCIQCPVKIVFTSCNLLLTENRQQYEVIC